MSGRKSNLRLYQNITAASMAGNVTSAVTNIQMLDNIGVQLNFTGTPSGTFEVQVSADHAQDMFGNVTNAGNWIPLTLTPSPTASGAAGQIYIDIQETSAPWLRIVYTRTGGTGTLDGYITAKMV